jgi:hypothetical protein
MVRGQRAILAKYPILAVAVGAERKALNSQRSAYSRAKVQSFREKRREREQYWRDAT